MCEQHFYGYAICPGIAIGVPLFFMPEEEVVPEFAVSGDQIEQEVARYYSALSSSQKDVQRLRQRLEQDETSEISKILGAHLEIMKDPLMTVQVERQIRSKGKNTEYIFKSVMGEYEEKYSRISSEFFRERLKDFQDIARRIMRHLRKVERETLASITKSSVIFAHELAPSDTAEANTECIDAFVTRTGSETSHVAIMARARGIPFVSSVDFPHFGDKMPQQVIVDGTAGLVIFDPSPQTLARYTSEQKKLHIQKSNLMKVASFEAETIDGYKASLSANIGLYDELEGFEEYGTLSIGLFRSEYLFLARGDFPSEEEQFQLYRSIVEKREVSSTVIRTFDLGGDKLGDLYPSHYEANPFLGCRAVRLMFKEPAAFKAQIRAILRASAFGQVSLLFPMISDMSELHQAKALVNQAKSELLANSVPFARNIPLGCMIEVPSAAICIDLLVQECDFLSIGTNDLVQYTLAVDRNHTQMRYLYQPNHPSVIRLMRLVLQEALRAKKPVAVCGEIAADPKYTPLLLGLGVHELSVSLPSLHLIKNVIRRFTIIEARELAEKVLTLTSAHEISETLQQFYQNLQKKYPF